jgi:hypothetical protein
MEKREPCDTFHWHPLVHEKWAREKLSFWKLGFSPTYDREHIVEGIESALALQRATAFTIYELSAGAEDIFVRAWLPGSPHEFEDALASSMGQYALRVASDGFFVSRIIAHWPWETAANALDVRPLSGVPSEPFPHHEIVKINTGTVTKEQREAYEASNLITPVRRGDGVKFFIVIGRRQAFNHTRMAREKLESRIKAVLRDATSIGEKSLYAGTGIGEYLLMGRTLDYFAIERELTQPLNHKFDFDSDGTRTMTYPSSRQGFLASRYDLKVDGSDQAAQSAADALVQEESQTLEVKGSALVNLGRWLNGDGTLERDEQIINGGFLKAVTGLLNANGGTLVIGALERDRFDGHRELLNAPHVGAYTVVGIQHDIGGAGWDQYERQLRDLLSSRIRPNPNAWVSISSEEVHGRRVAVLAIYPGNRGFYHYPQGDGQCHFWVRQGNRTVELSGPETDRYLKDEPD